MWVGFAAWILGRAADQDVVSTLGAVVVILAGLAFLAVTVRGRRTSSVPDQAPQGSAEEQQDHDGGAAPGAR